MFEIGVLFVADYGPVTPFLKRGIRMFLLSA